MRLTSVTLAFIFFGTVFATPIFPLRGNAVELSKRADPEAAIPDLTGGGDGEPPNSPTSRPGTPSSPARGRGSKRRARGSVSSLNKGKKRADVLAAEAQDSDGEIRETSTGGRKRSKSGQGRSSSASKKAKSDLLTQEQFDVALNNIVQGAIVGTAGSMSLGVYHISGQVLGHTAVVKIIDNRMTPAKIRGEVARDRTVDHLLGWGWTTGSRKLAYIVLKNMGTHVSTMPGLDLNTKEDQDFVKNKKDQALAHHEAEYGLKHTDPEGDGNYLWKHNPDGATKDEQYHVTPIDWDGAKNTGGGRLTTPPPLVVQNGVYAPASSQQSSDKASPSDGSGGNKTPPTKHEGVTGTRTGSRSDSKRRAAAGSGT